MRSPRSSICLAVAALTLAVGTGIGTLPAVAQTPVRPSTPLSVWNAPSTVEFDGLSTWLATFDDPTAGAGQVPPVYDYFHEFYFVGSESFGHISLEVVGTEKFASLVIFDAEESREHTVRVRFPWTGNSFYFLWVNRLADGLWGAWAYDNTAATWAFVGSLAVPTRLGKLLSQSTTGVGWTGPDLESCEAYPRAVMTRRAPVGYVGTTSVQTQLVNRFQGDGECPTTAAPFVPEWDYYVVGFDPPAAAAAAGLGLTPAAGSERRYFP